MGFFDGVVRGLKKGVTGGDNKMDLQDYLKLGGMAASAATGNVPGMIALGAGMLGDATGSEELALAGDIGSIAAGGVGAAGALSGGIGAAQAAGSGADAATGVADATSAVADGASAVADGASAGADGASLLSAGTQFSPEAIQGAGAAGNVFGQGADIAGQMSGVENFIGAIPPEMANGAGGGLGNTLKGLLGETGKERWETATDMAMDGGGAYAEEMAPPEAVPMEWQQTEDIMNYIPTHMSALKDYLASSGILGNQYTRQFNQYGG